MRKYKSGKGYCTLSLHRNKSPLVIYRVDKDRNPIISEEEIVLISLSRDSPEEKARISIHGKMYQFLRGNLLRNYNESRCNLSIGDWGKLKEIVNKKIAQTRSDKEGLERKVNK